MKDLCLMKQIYSQLLRNRKIYFMIGFLLILFIHSITYGSIQLEITDLSRHNTYQTLENFDFMSFERELSRREKTFFIMPAIKPCTISKVDSVDTIITYIPSSEISIDGNVNFHAQAQDPLNNWDLGGSLDGTKSKPYLIYNLDITPPNSGTNAISIQNTDVYFNLSTCLIHNGSNGINFNNVKYGIIHNNKIKDNVEDGIRTTGSTNNSFLFNEVYNNSVNGIILKDSENNIIFSNIVHKNADDTLRAVDGISLDNSNNSVISNNLVNENGQYGLLITNSYNCTVVNNIINNNGIIGSHYSGIGIYNCNFSVIRDNTIYNEPRYGLEVVNSFNCTISNITAYNNVDKGLSIYYCPNSTFNDLKSYKSNSVGVEINYSGNSTFTNFICVNNMGIGICIDSCGNSNISNMLSVNNTNLGVYIGDSGSYKLKDIHCENNTSFGFYCQRINNSVFTNITCRENNEGGILFTQVHHSTLEKSYSYSNRYGGITLDNSTYNTFLRNEIYNNNGAGIFFEYVCINNIISENYIYRNAGSGVYMNPNTNNNKITNNIIYNNIGYGIYFRNSFGHNISYNIVYNNTDTGINGHIDIELTVTPSRNNITKNDLIHNKFELESGVFYQIHISGQTDIFYVDHNFYDTHREPDEDNDDIVDYPYPLGEIWTDGGEPEYYYDNNPETEPINSAIIHYLSTPFIIYPKTWDPTNPGVYTQISVNRTVPIQFLTPIDSESHSLTYSLYFTRDWDWEWDLQNWTLIVSGITTTTYEWDTTKVLDGLVYLAVVAKCSDMIELVYIDTRSIQIDNSPLELTNILASPFPSFNLLLVTFLLLVLIERKNKKVKE